MSGPRVPSGFGLGLRYSFLEEVVPLEGGPSWFEIAPENWIGRGGYLRRGIERVRENFPIVCHGLSLSLGSPDPLDLELLGKIRSFLRELEIEVYSEHISFCSLGGEYLYDLLPLPFTEGMVKHVARKVQEAQDFLGMPLILENITYYYRPPGELQEWEFINAVLEESGSYLLLDVNNLYINSVNHRYDPYDFLERIKLERVAYLHVAGHERFNRLLIDTHGDEPSREVVKLLKHVISKVGKVPVLLERDTKVPPYRSLVDELRKLREACGYA
jgi:uncharacterized protein (UPF0276 family)